LNLWEGFRIGVCEAYSQDVQQAVESEGLDIAEGLAPLKMEEEPTHSFSVRRAGNVEVPATWDSFAPTVWKEKHRMMVMHLIYWHLMRELLGTSGLKKEAVVAVGEKSPQEKTEQLEGR
jgi:hypothetical protein